MKRVLTIQDISCLGKCSITIALPVISALGSEAVILPTAVLSTHTMFDGFTFRDLTDDLDSIRKHWQKETKSGGSFCSICPMGRRTALPVGTQTERDFDEQQGDDE